MPTRKQLSTYKPNQMRNIEFHGRTLVVRKKRDNVKTASQCNKRNTTNVNAQKLKNAQRELTNVYQKEEIEYLQSQINKIRNSVEIIYHK